MALVAVFDNTNPSGTHTDDWRLSADSSMAAVVGHLTSAAFGPAMAAIQDYRDQLTAVESLLIAQRKQAGHSDRSTEGIIKGSGRVSKNEAKKRTRRGSAVGRNPGLAAKLTSGELSSEHVDLLADASEQTGGIAASDPELIRDVAAGNPDQGRAVVKKYVDQHESASDRETRHQRQRRLRTVIRSRTVGGMSQIILEGDDISIDAALRTIRRRADAMYRKDGGRDVADGNHERTHHQRMFDAAIGQLVGDPSDSAPSAPDTTAPETSPCAGSGAGDSHMSASSTPRGKPAPAKVNRPGQRPLMVFTGHLSDITDDPETLAAWEVELIGTGRVPVAVAEYYRCISDHAAQLVSGTGAVLWQGRARRHATAGQWTALIVRDQGCVLCAADHTECEAHHILPYEAPIRGETNIDQLALVCVDCHHRIHDNRQTLFKDEQTRSWRLRAATSAEIAPTGRRPRAESTPASSPAGPHQRETAAGTIRDDLFDWLE
ncbi:MAG: hypothetical protein ACI81L_000870 [Verrucomicrobiales bacterium]|jgi:hypothetical protein